MKNKFIAYPVILFIMCGLCAIIISGTNYITDPIIKNNQAQTLKDNLNSLYDNVKEYELIKDNKALNDPSLVNLYKLSLSDGKEYFVYETSNIGKNGSIVSLISFGDNKIDKIINITHNETKGIGSRIDEVEYLNAITSQDIANLDIDIIAGATYSSSALKKSVEAASQNYLKGDLN